MADWKDLRRDLRRHLYQHHHKFSPNQHAETPGVDLSRAEALEAIHDAFHVDGHCSPPHSHAEPLDIYQLGETILDGENEEYVKMIVKEFGGVDG